MDNGKVLVAIATPRMMWGDCVSSLINLAKFCHDRADFKIVVGCEIGVARNIAVRIMLDKGYKGICFIDSDQTFPEDALDELIRTDKDIIGYVIRASRQSCLNMGTFIPNNKYNQISWRDYPENSVFEVDWIGTGFTYYKRGVFEKIPFPWFLLTYEDDFRYRIHSDFYMSLKAKEAGFSIYACSTKRIGHMAIVEKFPPEEFIERPKEDVL